MTLAQTPPPRCQRIVCSLVAFRPSQVSISAIQVHTHFIFLFIFIFSFVYIISFHSNIKLLGSVVLSVFSNETQPANTTVIVLDDAIAACARGCDGIPGSGLVNDTCGVCGGKNFTCVTGGSAGNFGEEEGGETEGRRARVKRSLTIKIAAKKNGKDHHLGAIIGGTVGGFFGVSFLFYFVFFLIFWKFESLFYGVWFCFCFDFMKLLLVVSLIAFFVHRRLDSRPPPSFTITSANPGNTHLNPRPTFLPPPLPLSPSHFFLPLPS